MNELELHEPERLSSEPDNIRERIEKGLKLVSSYLPTNLPLKYRNKAFRYSDIPDIVKELRITVTQAKVVYWMLLVGYTYPSELRRIYGGGAQPFKDAITALAHKGFVIRADPCNALKVRQSFLDKELYTTPQERKQNIFFYTLKPDAVLYFQQMKDEIREKIAPHIGKAEPEAQRYRAVLEQIKNNEQKRQQLDEAKKKEDTLKEWLSSEVDKLLIAHRNDFPTFKSEVELLTTRYPTQKAHIFKLFQMLEKIHKGERGAVTWDVAVSQALRKQNMLTIIPKN